MFDENLCTFIFIVKLNCVPIYFRNNTPNTQEMILLWVSYLFNYLKILVYTIIMHACTKHKKKN